jgi:hypothetical protein
MMMFPNKETVERLRRTYPKGTKVKLISMSDPYTTLRPGDVGVIDFIDDAGTAHVIWNNGSYLGVIFGEDRITIMEP